MATVAHLAVGRRKTAVARVRLLPGTGVLKINQRNLKEYFPTLEMQQAAQGPLTITSQAQAVDLEVKVTGGGKRAQADAVKLGIARALLKIDVNFRKQLKEAGFLRRDSRMKERKKPGLKRARRAPQFSKR